MTRSAVAWWHRTDETVTLYFADDESHSTIREEHHIPDGTDAESQWQTRVEYVPGERFLDLDCWKFRFDAGRPAWWTDEHTSEAVRQFRAELDPRLARLRESGEWPLPLRFVGEIPADLAAMLVRCGDIYAPGATSLSLPMLSQCGYIDARSCAGVNLSDYAAGRIYAVEAEA